MRFFKIGIKIATFKTVFEIYQKKIGETLAFV